VSRQHICAQKRAACIRRRSPFSGGGQRVVDWGKLACLGGGYAELKSQTAYSLAPHRYFQRQVAPPDVFMLFRDTPERRHKIQNVMEGGGAGLGGEQLFGFEELRQSGLAVDCNLRLPRSSSARQILHGWQNRRHISQTGIGLGDECSVRAHLWQIRRSKVVLATNDNTGLPACRLKSNGLFSTPLVYVSIGLPERLMLLETKKPEWVELYQKWLSSVDQFVAYGHAEAEWLRRWLGPKPQVQFIPFGVDVKKWAPMEVTSDGVDVLSIGADPRRDYNLLIAYARSRPEVRVCLVAGPDCLVNLEDLPSNLLVEKQMPIEKLKEKIAAARVVALPVKENTYSGATTTLLQCMAMEKPVAVSRVGAIREGYGFSDRENLRWLEPGSEKSILNVLDDMLAHQERSEELGIEARRHVMKHLGWSRYVDNLNGCLKIWTGKGETK